jgi:tetratricopeptide (TPR) repeat protein
MFEANDHFRAGRFWDSLQIADEILAHAQGRLRVRLQLLRARCQAENPHWRHRAVEDLREALREAPASAELHYELASLYRRVGLAQRARAELQATLACDPGHAAARAELEGSEGMPSGILSGLRERLAAARSHVVAS